MGKQVDKNDFWFIEKNPITKVGVYPYLGKQISQDCEPNKIYYVLRPKEELFRKETLDSLRLIPLIDGHTMIGKDFTAPEDKGLDGTLGDNVSHDTDTIYNDLKIISNKMKEEIQNGKKELSLGYFCRYDKQPGTYKGQRYDYVQRDIIANHLALVDKGRMGADVRVYDSQNIPEGEAFAMDSIDISLDKEFNENDVNRDDRGRFATKGQSAANKEKDNSIPKFSDFIENEVWETPIPAGEELKYKQFVTKLAPNIYRAVYSNGEWTGITVADLYKEWKDGTWNGEDMPKSEADWLSRIRLKHADKISADSDEDIEWITVRGTHVPIKKGESKEQAVKNFLESKKQSSGNNETKKHKSGLSSQKVARFRELLNKKDTETIEKEFGKKIWSENAIEQLKSSLSLKYDKGSKDPNLPDFEYLKEDNEQSGIKTELKKGDKIRFADTQGVEYKFVGENRGMLEFENIDDDSDKKGFPKGQLEERLKDGSMQISGNKAEPENEWNNERDKENERHEKLMIKLKKEIEDATDPQEKRDLIEHRRSMIKEHNRRLDRIFKDEEEAKQAGKNKGTQDSMEYKTIQGEGKMADKKEKVAIDEDKRKLIDEIGGILKEAGIDDELIRTVIGKAEKIAYNKSEAGDDGEEVEEEVVNEEVEEEGKDKKAAKDKCGKDEEEDEDKEEEEKKKVVKAFAQKEKLGKEVEDALGTFDHSEMTELEIAKYACDKLDLEVEKGQEISAVKGYLKGLAKAPKASFGYKTVAADSGIQTTDAEFEKFINKGE